MVREIIFSKKVEQYLDELMLLLFEEGYFGFPDSAKTYVDRLISFIEQHVTFRSLLDFIAFFQGGMERRHNLFFAFSLSGL